MDEERILIVDDDDSLRNTLSSILKTKGYAPAAVATGQAALGQPKPAVALIDLRLDGMQGLEVVERIKRQWPDTECVVVTGYGSQELASEASSLGAYDYIEKPYDQERLLAIIRGAIEKREEEGFMDDGKVTLALLGAKIDTVIEKLDEYRESMEDHDRRIRELEQDSARQEERLGMFAAGLTLLQLTGSAIAAWIGVRN